MSNGTGGGVRNLRAMFENNSQPASPDVRGRSPSARSNDDSSRPLSKVRTSFVSVEPIKRIRNDTPEQRGDSDTHRRESFSLNESRPSDAEALSEMKKTVSHELELRKSNSSVAEVVPENAIVSEAPTPFTAAEKQLDTSAEAITVPSVTSTSVSRATSESRPETQALDSSPPAAPAAPAGQPAKDQTSPFSTSPRVIRNLAENLRTPQPAAGKKPQPQQPPNSPTPAAKRQDAKKVEPKAKPAQASAPASAPASTTAQPEVAEKAQPKPVQETPKKTGTERPGRTSSRVSSGTVTTGGFVKPKPRSPTRPVKLPAHLIAPTASSAAKHGDSPPSQRTLSRRSSTISTASRRPSIRAAHPPKQTRPKQAAHPPAATENKSPPPKSPTAPSTFLERMMRPTASSASKVKEKIDTTKGKK
ncbi:uncharacterized protein PV09_07023 [Verruconis gallopava]|uniref:Uncharacterized protein n=1 Tax=Verruconis gallopava TaxID=253628 RepID=A0A0D2A4Z5_9PEZI|nr:uncharacterized protein PV09_07023 [Verruconis gallopava]KIW01545.1 hypothetical protein PV09_07023 [Verruconis gallopava]